MRMMIWTCATVLLIGGVAEAAEKGAPLDGAKCHALWSLLSPKDDAITKYKADTNVIDFAMVDTDRNGSIDANEFMAGCKNGWIRDNN